MSFLVSESGSEPVTLATAKAWLKTENADEDTLITALITSCRKEIESYTKQALRSQVWRTKYIADEYNKTIFYAPRHMAASVSITIDSVLTTDYTFLDAQSRVQLNAAYAQDSVIAIDWTIEPQLSALSTLTQCLLDLIAYRFYNRVTSDIPQAIKSVLSQYRFFNV